MKATVDTKNFKITLDNEAIRAIRFVYGLPTDLRCKLDHVDKGMLWDWINNNGLGIFGNDYIEFSKIQATDDNWDKFEKMLYNVVEQILN